MLLLEYIATHWADVNHILRLIKQHPQGGAWAPPSCGVSVTEVSHQTSKQTGVLDPPD